MQVVLKSVRFAVVLDLKNSHHGKSKVCWTVYIGIVVWIKYCKYWSKLSLERLVPYLWFRRH